MTAHQTFHMKLIELLPHFRCCLLLLLLLLATSTLTAICSGARGLPPLFTSI